jgi:thymidylate synthase (FAD)
MGSTRRGAKIVINVLDKGYVRLVDSMGSDLSVVNSARVSYDKSVSEMNSKDEGLIRYLAKHDHTSPFRHAFLQFEIYAPLMVARQWWKYCIGSAHQDIMQAWNESSRRYITEHVEQYVPLPHEWRSKPENSKQGSGEPLKEVDGMELTTELMDYAKRGNELYEKAMKMGVAAEQARLFLPAYGTYVRWYWSASLYGVAHFLNQRLAHDAQKEIQDYAVAIDKLAREKFPLSIGALTPIKEF